jgi:acetylornithine deacetylase/succinyl-diaminopimelate desuccinylase-like protein
MMMETSADVRVPLPVLDYIDSHYTGSIEELFELLRIPGMSSVAGSAGDMRRAAGRLLGYMRQIGLDGAIYETSGHPIVYAELCPYPDAPTVLFCAHYDVAPPGLPEEWTTPPFSPVIKDGCIYARGAVDDKGQIFTILQALHAILAVDGRLPMNVKLLFEGEEEAGSPNIGAFVTDHLQMLKADAVIVIDILKYRADLPAIYYGAKGLLAAVIDVTGPAIDVHSGIYGGEIANPAQALCHILDNLKNSDGKILIPGFYDHVRDIAPEERSEIASLPFDEGAIEARLGVSTLVTEKGYTPQECIMFRPTLDVNGLRSGALPDEPLMIIPTAASALLSMRLVPDQSPDDIYSLLEAYVRTITPPGVRVEIKKLFGNEPFVTPRDSAMVRIASRAIGYAFGTRPVLVRSGGTSEIVSLLETATGVKDIIVTGWGDPGDGEHSPNEHFSLENYRKGIIATAAIMYELARHRPAIGEPVGYSTQVL